MWTDSEPVEPLATQGIHGSINLESWLAHQHAGAGSPFSVSKRTAADSSLHQTSSHSSQRSFEGAISLGLDGPLAGHVLSPQSRHAMSHGEISESDFDSSSSEHSANLLSPVTAEEMGISAEGLQHAFSAQPPAVLLPEHANRQRGKTVASATPKKRRRGTETPQHHIDHFLRCYAQRDLRDSAALRTLEEFVFSVPTSIAEEAQQAALEVYTTELQAALSRKQKAPGVFAHYAPANDTPLEKLRLFLSIMAETNTALQKEKKKHHLYPLSVAPGHHFVESPTSSDLHVFKDITLKNPGSRAYRYWIHTDFFEEKDTPKEEEEGMRERGNSMARMSAADSSGKGYDFHVLSNSNGEVKKRETQSVHISLILQGRRAKRGVRELVVLESEYGFKHFLSLNVVRQVGALGLSLGQCGVVLDQNHYVPLIFKRLRERFVEAGGLTMKDVFMLSKIRAIHVPKDWKLIADDPVRLKRADARLVAAMMLRFTEGVANREGCLGVVDSGLAERELNVSDPMRFIERSDLPYASQQLALWWLTLLSSVLKNTATNAARPRLLCTTLAPTLFRFPRDTLLDSILLHQQAAQLLNFILTYYSKNVTS